METTDSKLIGLNLLAEEEKSDSMIMRLSAVRENYF